MSDYSQPPPDALIGQTIAGRYRIISRLGAGGMGVAYRAWDEAESVPVVVKMPKKAFLEDPTFAERFYREIRLLQGLRHEHIVPILNVGAHEVLPFVVMRFLPGGSLSNRRLRDDNGKARPNPPGMLHLWLPAVAEALDFIHQMGVVHRDVKPANIFFDAFWGAFLGDFGIAKVVTETDSFDGEATLTATSMGIGTLDYMGPELFVKTSNVDGRADQYALAVVAYEILAGTRPFTGDMDNIVVEVTKMLPPRLDQRVAGLPRSAVEAVHRGLAKRPAERFASCRQFAKALLRDIPPLEPEPDTARFLCPSCSNLLRLPVTAAGRKGKCPKCREQMKIADDLGTLWLLDEQRRQRLTPPNATPTNALPNPFEPEPPAADEPLEDFKPISDHLAIRRVNLRRRKRTWNADLVGSVAVVAVAVALAFVLFQVLRSTPPPVNPSGPQPRKREQPIADLAESKKKNLSPSPAGPSTPSPEEILSQKPLINSAGMQLKLLPPGTFIMGSEDGEPDEQPAHTVRITRPFYLGVTEVTNSQWKHVMGSEPPSRWKEDERPVEMVNWDEAVEFCRRLGEMPEEKAAGRTYRLPTEAEWEYACRAGTTTRFSFGDDESQYGDYGWFPANADKQTRPVGRKKPNAWGLHDMHGNVWEWCSDWYGPYPSGIIVDPTGPARGSSRIHRGGGYATPAIPAAFRQEDRNLALRHERLGFRVVFSAPADGLTDAKDIEDTTQWLDGNPDFLELAGGKRPPKAKPKFPEGAIAFNGHTYFFPRDQTNQIEARLAAEKLGGGLVVIDDADENAFIAKNVQGPTWIGIGKVENSWVHLAGGVRATFFSWDGGQPSNNPGEVAAAIWENGAWHDHFGTDQLFYVVEWPEALNDATPGNSSPSPSGSEWVEIAAANGGGGDTEQAVDRALKWIVQHQMPDGGWSFDLAKCPSCMGKCSHSGESKGADRCGATAMALLPFLGRGYTHREGPYKKPIEAGIGFLVQMAIKGKGKAYAEGGSLYSQGLAGITLSECFAMSQDGRLAAPTQAVLNFIMASQDPVGGGWRYLPRERGDTSASGWQIMALKSGSMAYLQVNPMTVKRAVEFLDSVKGDEYGSCYGYTGPGDQPGTSAVGLLCRMYLGWKKDNPGIQEGTKKLAKIGPTKDLYYDYYATQIMYHMQGDMWISWNNKMKAMLLKTQSNIGHESGSWYQGVDEGEGPLAAGRLYCTALASLILEVYYDPPFNLNAEPSEFHE